MKVFVIGTRGFPNIQGGVEKHCESLYPLIAENDSKIKLTIFRRKPYISRKALTLINSNYNFVDLWVPRNKYLETIIHSFQAAICCLFKRPDIVHIHNIGPALVLPILKVFGLKVVVTYHSDNYNHDKWGVLAKTVLKLGEWLVERMADRIIVVSKHQLDFFVHKEKVLNIPNGVTIKHPSESNDSLQTLGLFPSNYILAVARFAPEKGLDILVQAFRKYKGSLKLVIAGDTDHETAYSINLKRQIALDNRIVTTGYITGNCLADIFANARLFVLASRNEGLPIALLEALGYGIPVLASDIAANREVGLSDDRYFRVGDVEDLLRKIEANSDLIPSQKEKERCMNVISKKYNWKFIAKQTISVYRSIVGNQRAPFRFNTT